MVRIILPDPDPAVKALVFWIQHMLYIIYILKNGVVEISISNYANYCVYYLGA
jgi:hypothetical protein